jgi:hypothetical protein
MYLPIMAIASSQDLTIEIRLRDVQSLVQHWHKVTTLSGPSATTLDEYKLMPKPAASTKATFYPAAFPEITECQLLCHYFQLSAAEADALQTKPQHVRLVRQIQSEKSNTITMPGANDGSFTTKTENVTLSFLHPVQTLWLVLRDPDDLANNEYFKYLGKPDDDCRITSWDLVINGQSRMPEKTDADYTMQRIVPLIHGHGKRSYGSARLADASAAAGRRAVDRLRVARPAAARRVSAAAGDRRRRRRVHARRGRPRRGRPRRRPRACRLPPRRRRRGRLRHRPPFEQYPLQAQARVTSEPSKPKPQCRPRSK